MSDIIVDSSVILDLVTDDPNWSEWSEAALTESRRIGRLIINPIIYAEVSIGFSRIEVLNQVISLAGFSIKEIPKEALFLAGKAFIKYKRRKGSREGVLPDFFIGAHAAVEDIPLLTRDISRVRSYFPTVKLISP